MHQKHPNTEKPSEPNMNSTTLSDAPRLTMSDVVTEGFILLAMALVTLALGTGLFLQFNLGFVAAVICALSVYLGLLASHALVHRNSAVTELKRELSNLEKQFTRAIGRTDGSHKNEKTQKTTPAAAMALPEIPSVNASMNAQSIVPRQTPPDLSVLAPVGTKDATQAIATQEDIMSPATPSEDDVLTVPIFKSSSPDQNLSKPVSIAAQRHSQETSSEQLTPPPAPPSSRPPRESDVDMIKGLIKKLADEVNATSELPNSDDQNSVETPPVARETTTGPKPLAKQSLDFSKLKVPSTDEATLAEPTQNTPELKTELDENTAGDPIEKKSSGPVSIASQVISKQSFNAPPEDQDQEDHQDQEKTEQTQLTKDAESSQSASDHAIEVSLNALRTTAKAMRGQEPSAPAEIDQQNDFLPQIDQASIDPIVNETTANFETRDDIDEKLVGLSQDTPEAVKTSPTGAGVFAIISEALGAGRVDVLLDPILGLENRRAQHFEISVRLRDIDNSVIDTKAHCENFVGTGLETMLDRETLSRTATVALQLDSRGRHGAVFSKVAAESFAAEEFIDDVYAAFQARSTLSSQLVMTLTQEHVRRLGVREWTTLTDLKNLGFRFAVSSVTDLDMDFEDLSEKGYTFVKLDADVFLNGLQAGQVRIPADDICNHLANMGITTIVDHIEDDAVLGQLRDLGVQFGQGQLFGGPRTVKAQALKTARGNAA